jgi:hypothetical protein
MTVWAVEQGNTPPGITIAIWTRVRSAVSGRLPEPSASERDSARELHPNPRS